jgi:glycosyltransferase involved in cell wall biosynthesis
VDRNTPAVLSVFDVEPRFIGGTETYAKELSVQLADAGWRSVVCFAAPPSADVRRFLELPSVSLEVVEGLGGPRLPVMPRLAGVLRRHRPRIAHFHYEGFLSPYPWAARMLGAEQVFFTDHSSRPAHYQDGPAPWMKRCLARAVNVPLSKVICVSEYGYRCFTQRGLFPTERCQMIYNGVDISRAEDNGGRAAAFRGRFGIPNDRAVVLQVSWIIPEKGVLDLLEAARIVTSQSPRAHFVIVGEGPFRAEYTERAGELGLADRITWTGLVEDVVGAGAYDAAEVVCQVSRWEEVFGWVIAEAMACEKPVIATRVGGIPEVVADDESGWLIERGDVEGLARKVLRLLEDPARRQAMGVAGKKRVAAKFNLRTNVAQLVRAYGIDGRASA